MDLNSYKGDGYPPDGKKAKRYPYLADKGLVQVVNMAIKLERPLLVKGSPGCGKTQLAYSVAHELGLELYTWYIKSTSQAKDGLYMIDAIRRLHDAQHRGEDSKLKEIWDYVKFKALGNALRNKNQSVLLIDEIDKADIDFPNDLLRELDEKQFEIEELDADDPRRLQKALSSPIIIITSNDEKELPDAFLRRCLFYYIPFPTREELIDIVNINLMDEKLDMDKELMETAVHRLLEMREIKDFRKSPSTSELIDWVKVLHYWETEFNTIKDMVLSKLPYLEVLFKHKQDLQTLARKDSQKDDK